MKKMLSLALASLLLLGLCGCAPSVGASVLPLAALSFPDPPSSDDYDSRLAYYEENDVENEFTNALNRFSCSSASTILSGAEGNANFSPLSLYYTLSILAKGTGGESRSQLLNLLGSEDTDRLSEQCARLFRRLYSQEDEALLTIANSVWLQNGLTFKDEFIRNAAENFYAESYSVDFGQDSTGKAMSKWVSDHTGGTLSPQMPINEDTVMAVLNALHFKSGWLSRFDSAKTTDGIFHAEDSDMSVSFMSSEEIGGYSEGDGFISSSLGLDNDCRMTFILPDEGVSVEQLLASAGSVEALLDGTVKRAIITWKLPKFSFDCKYELSDSLKELGVTDLFDRDLADLSGVTSKPAYLSQAAQETHIAIDETGVEASAYTGLYVTTSSSPSMEVDFTLDRPFIFCISSHLSGTSSSDAANVVLFMGICRTPTPT